MNEGYWEEYYKTFKVEEPSDFAKFCLNRFADGSVLDLGCGNGRDTHFFKEQGLDVTGYDRAMGVDAKDVSGYWDNLYMRWFIHSIPEELEDEILNKIGCQKLFIECRSDNDKPLEDHERRLINGNHLLQKLISFGYKIEYFEESYGWSKLNGEDPCLIRVIATA